MSLRNAAGILAGAGKRPWPFALDLTGHRVAGLGFLVAKVPPARHLESCLQCVANLLVMCA